MPTEEPTLNDQKKKRAAWVIPAILYALVAGGILWWLFQPRKTFRIEAELLVERLTFRYLEGPASFAQGEMLSCAWQNFEAFRLEGDSLLLDEGLDGDYEEKQGLPSSLVLRADPAISGLSVSFGAARLEKILLTSGALLTLSLPEADENLFRITVEQEEKLQADWTYKDSLIVQVEQVQVEGLKEHDAFFYPAQLKLLPPNGLAREFRLNSFPGSTTLDFALDQQLSMESEQLFIAEPSFFKPVETVAVPTLLKGEIRLMEANREPFQQISLQEGEGLNIIPVDRLALDQLQLEEGAIALRLSGQVARLETGADYELRNPTRLEWLWHNRRFLLIALGVALIGLAAFLPEKVRERFFSTLKLIKGF